MGLLENVEVSRMTFCIRVRQNLLDEEESLIHSGCVSYRSHD